MSAGALQHVHAVTRAADFVYFLTQLGADLARLTTSCNCSEGAQPEVKLDAQVLLRGGAGFSVGMGDSGPGLPQCAAHLQLASGRELCQPE